jgi:hypothetical protein
MRPTACLETSVTNYLSQLRKVSEEQKADFFKREMSLLRGTNWIYGILKTIHRRVLSFIHLTFCLPKLALQIVRSRASSFKWEYPLLSLSSSSSFVRLLPRLPVPSIPPYSFPSITSWRRQFLNKSDQSSSTSVYVFHVGEFCHLRL